MAARTHTGKGGEGSPRAEPVLTSRSWRTTPVRSAKLTAWATTCPLEGEQLESISDGEPSTGTYGSHEIIHICPRWHLNNMPNQRLDLHLSDMTAAATLWCGARVLRPDALQAGPAHHADFRWIQKELGGAHYDGEPAQEAAVQSADSKSPQQPLRRSQRHSGIQAVPSGLPVTHRNAHIVYVLGQLPRSDRHQWNKLLRAFHSDESVQQTLTDILENAQRYLQWQDSSHGLSYESKQPIPKDTRFCFFSGKLTTREAAASSKHLIGLGDKVDGHAYEVVVDGSGVSSEELGLGQAMNHSCSPNAEVEVIETDSGLDLLAIKASRDIPARVEVSIHYDQRASAKDKRNRLTFWEWNPPTSSPPVGRWHRIQCGCAKPCPNNLWRDELRSRNIRTQSAPPRSNKNRESRSIPTPSSFVALRAQKHSPPSETPSFAPFLPTPRVLAANPAGLATPCPEGAEQERTAAVAAVRLAPTQREHAVVTRQESTPSCIMQAPLPSVRTNGRTINAGIALNSSLTSPHTDTNGRRKLDGKDSNVLKRTAAQSEGEGLQHPLTSWRQSTLPSLPMRAKPNIPSGGTGAGGRRSLPDTSVSPLVTDPGTAPHTEKEVNPKYTEGIAERISVQPEIEEPSADLASSMHRYSGMSTRDLWEHLEGLRAEDNDLDAALGALRGLEGDLRATGLGRISRSGFDSTGQKQQLQLVATRDVSETGEYQCKTEVPGREHTKRI